ncbi:hypothetical protein [Streptomyces sp. NPDC058463]|uniref:hypothetical protein n=1 Tax=Streptomyces sp. NPDC058463 TaxID=3346510 RepID=UPI0036496339
MLWTVSPARAAHRTGPGPRDGAPLVAARAAVFAVAGTALAASSHHLVSGHGLTWRAGLLAAAALFLLVLPVVRRTRSLTVVWAATGGAQGALHWWLQQATLHPAPGAAAVHHAAHHSTPQAHQLWNNSEHATTAMTAAHLTAALLVAWGVQQAERACRAAAAAGVHLSNLLRRLQPSTGTQHVCGQQVPPATRLREPSRPSHWVLLAHAVVRRGPPMTRAIPFI